MAGQQQQIIDTIFSMKRRILRHDDSSDAEETDTPYHNRMQSLKRKAQYTRSSKLESATEAPPYKKRIEHAGYQRFILHRNPPQFDPDGDVVEMGDEYEDESELSTVEENPYADVQLENLLAPLTSAADLPTHPAMSVPYTSKHLTRMTTEAGEMARKEQIHLWRAKSLFTKLQGDVAWIPSGLADMTEIEHLQDPWADGAPKPATNGDTHEAPQIEINAESQTQDTSNTAQDVDMADAEQPSGAVQEVAQDSITNGNTEQDGDKLPESNGISHSPRANGTQDNTNGDNPADDASDTASQPTSHRMTTRARAHAPSDPSPPSSPSSTINPIHPLFTFPTSSLPDRDYGLPSAEAEDTRMLLMAFVQKQEEIARLAIDLHAGMLKGERMRQDVFKWAKAEAHIGEMSDGEDWYDAEEWGLEEALGKGRDEEDDDAAVGVGQGKKSTRQRRKPDKEDR